ncbi:MAG: calcium-binding protein, partial [Selenomonadaceae bacterium]|nr:calcium-binding protein [Selenomonadaceae bacterium]
MKVFTDFDKPTFFFDLQRFDTSTEDENYIDNYASYSSVSGTSGDDFIQNLGDYSTVYGNAGNDSIDNLTFIVIDENYEVVSVLGAVNHVIIEGNAGNDSITNYNLGATISGGEGNDTIRSYGGTVIDEEFNSLGTSVVSGSFSLDGGAGDDIVINENNSTTITGGEGDDSIINAGANASIDGGAGDDIILSENSSVTINGGAGKDLIFNDGSNVTIAGGEDDDTIDSSAENVLIQYAAGDGNDSITDFNSTSTLSISGSEYSSEVSGNDIIITVGDGKIILDGAATLSTVNIISVPTEGDSDKATEGDDTIENNLDNVTINALGGNDSIENYGASVIINGGDGNDTISTPDVKSDVTVNGGAGKDVINGSYMYSLLDGGADGDGIVVSGGIYTTINGGEGNDTLGGNQYFMSSISGGAGNDTIMVIGYGNTISGDGGSDVIANLPESMDSDFGDYRGNVYQYANGNGSDLIMGFHEADTLQIGDGKDTYSKEINGDDIVITVGENSVTLQDAASLSTINIAGTEVILPTEGDDTIENDLDDVTINALGGNDTVENYGANVLFQYNEGDGNDLITGFNETSTLQIGDGTDTYSKEINGNDVFITVGESSVTLREAASLSAVNIAGTEVIISTDGDDTIVNKLDNVTINALGGNDTVENYGANVLFQYN